MFLLRNGGDNGAARRFFLRGWRGTRHAALGREGAADIIVHAAQLVVKDLPPNILHLGGVALFDFNFVVQPELAPDDPGDDVRGMRRIEDPDAAHAERNADLDPPVVDADVRIAEKALGDRADALGLEKDCGHIGLVKQLCRIVRQNAHRIQPIGRCNAALRGVQLPLVDQRGKVGADLRHAQRLIRAQRNVFRRVEQLVLARGRGVFIENLQDLFGHGSTVTL